MRNGQLVPLWLFLGLCASFAVSLLAGWLILGRIGLTQVDPLLHPGMGFREYATTRFFLWDGQWYDVIARQGYHWHPSTTDRQSLAFFPLWGLVIRPIYALIAWHPRLFVVGLTAGLAYLSIHLAHRLGRELIGERAALWATAFYTFYPAGHYLLESYPTALMNVIVLLVLRDVLRGREWRPALLAGIGTAAGPLMVVPGFLVWLVAVGRRRDRLTRPGVLLTLLGIGVLGLSGLLGFVLWQKIALHDPFAFLMAQKPWDQPRSIAYRLWRFCWMMLVVPDVWHGGRLVGQMIGEWRMGHAQTAFVRYQFLVNFTFMTLLMLGLFWTWAVKPRRVALFGLLAMMFYVWFHGTTHNGLSTMRLVYICLPGFWGLGRAVQGERVWRWSLLSLSVLALLGQEICSDIGELVI